MIESIVRAFQSIVKKPLILLPALLLPVLMLALLFIFQGPISNLLVEALFLENIPESPLAAFPVHFAAMYPIEVAVVALLALVLAIVGIAVTFLYSRLASDFSAGEPSLGKVLGATLESRGNIAVLAVFFFIIVAFFVTIAWLFILVSALNSIVGLILLICLGLLLLYTAVKLSFTVPAMAVEGLKAKEALVKSWVFTGGRFWQVLVFLVIVSIISGVIIGIGNLIGTLVLGELIGGIVFIIFWLFGIAFSNLAIPFYYIKNSFGK